MCIWVGASVESFIPSPFTSTSTVSPQKVSVPSRDTSQTGHLRMKDERHTLKYPASAEMSTVSLRWTGMLLYPTNPFITNDAYMRRIIACA